MLLHLLLVVAVALAAPRDDTPFGIIQGAIRSGTVKPRVAPHRGVPSPWIVDPETAAYVTSNNPRWARPRPRASNTTSVRGYAGTGPPTGRAGEGNETIGKRATLGTIHRVATSFPYSSVVKIYAEWGSDVYGCSGAMISPFHVLTAGHCIHDGGRRSDYADNVLVVPGQGDAFDPVGHPAKRVSTFDYEFWLDMPFGWAWTNNMASFRGWTNDADYDWDIAIISLDRPLGLRTGYMGRQMSLPEIGIVLGYPSKSSIDNGGVCGDCCGPSRYPPGGVNQVQHIGEVIASTAEQVTLDVIGEFGNSGGPAYTFHTTTGDRSIFAVLSNGCDPSDAPTAFSRISDAKWDAINDMADVTVDVPPQRSFVIRMLGGGSFGLSKDTAEAGETVTVDLVLQNVGWVESGTITLNYFLTPDVDTDPAADSGTNIFETTTASLPSWTHGQVSQTIVIPPLLPPDDYFFFVRVSHAAARYELDTDDMYDIFLGPIFIAPPASPCDSSDANGGPTCATVLTTSASGWTSEADEDWFVLSATAGVEYTFTLAFSHQAGDLELDLLTDCGATRDSCTVRESGTSGSDDEVLTITMSADESIWIRVYGYEGAPSTPWSLTVAWTMEEPTPSPPQPITPVPTGFPTSYPTPYPTVRPTSRPTAYPTVYPTVYPTLRPTSQPTSYPTPYPTSYPTSYPTRMPTRKPTAFPTTARTSLPTKHPTKHPTAFPTLIPTSLPTLIPTSFPTVVPTASPTLIPTAFPTVIPTALPTSIPTSHPTVFPTPRPTVMPTASPTDPPTPLPSVTPTVLPPFTASTVSTVVRSTLPLDDPTATRVPTTVTPPPTWTPTSTTVQPTATSVTMMPSTSPTLPQSTARWSSSTVPPPVMSTEATKIATGEETVREKGGESGAASEPGAAVVTSLVGLCCCCVLLLLALTRRPGRAAPQTPSSRTRRAAAGAGRAARRSTTRHGGSTVHE